MDLDTVLKAAFIAIMVVVAVLVLISEGMRYYRTLGDLDQAEHDAHYHERIWDPRDEWHGRE